MLEGIGLTYKFITDHTVSIRAQKDSTADAGSGAPLVEEVVVTGTHISGGASASPTSAYTREQIIRSGAGTVQDFVQRIPQNYANISENNPGGIVGYSDDTNSTGASGFNLRGLGDGATLTLIDGHRMAGGGDYGTTVDLSLIPLAAVERIEVVTDGASAIYGADAVGGVVNFILRKSFEGAEFRVRYGSTTDGASDHLQIAQTIGRAWERGSFVSTYQFSKQSPLNAVDRDFAKGAAGTFLAPRYTIHNVFLLGRQLISDRLQVSENVTFGKRLSASTCTMVRHTSAAGARTSRTWVAPCPRAMRPKTVPHLM